MKTVWRQGCLQDKDGPSFATEAGPLTINDTKGFGAYVGGIVSTCPDEALIIHQNAEVQILPQTFDLDLYGGAILEPPPSKYVIRPVAEFFVEHNFGGIQTYSALVGGIWQLSDKLALDAAIREALIAGKNVSEVRAGLLGRSRNSRAPGRAECVCEQLTSSVGWCTNFLKTYAALVANLAALAAWQTSRLWPVTNSFAGSRMRSSR